ncbi:MAG: amidohydrolase family protein, partial [Nitrospirales bacterium]|nr:amidohydrolase family protein [Nitrospirales bacterium]
IDVIATDHAPHHRDEKEREFDKAPSGISGLETAWGLSLRLVQGGVLSLHRLVEALAVNPARILGIGKGTLVPGSDADIVLVDTESERKVEADRFVSKGKNTPFSGWRLRGAPVTTIVGGRIHEIRQ